MVSLPSYMVDDDEPVSEARPDAYRPSGNTDFAFAEKVLSHVSTGGARDPWITVIFGIADKFGEAGKELARSWSVRDHGSYNDKDFETLWRSTSRPYSGRKITWGSVEKMAEDQSGIDCRSVWREVRGVGEARAREDAEAAAQLKYVSHKPIDGSATPPASLTPGPAPYAYEMFRDIDPNITKDWLVEDLCGVGELCIPYGPPGCGKSVLIGDLGCHIAGGLDWHGRRVKQGIVLYVAAERPMLVKRRFAAFRKHHGIDDLPIAVIGGYFDMAKVGRDTDRIIATVKALEEDEAGTIAAVIIDTKAQVVGDDNSSVDMPAFVSNVARLQNATDAAVIVIDHTAFHAPKKMRGHTSLLGAADTTLLIEKGSEVRTATVQMANETEEGQAIAFTLTSVSLGTDQRSGKVTTAPVVEPADAVPEQSAGSGRLTPSQRIALEALKEAITDSGEPCQSSHIPDNTPTVHVDLWRDYAYRRGISDADTMEARKKAFQRARSQLLAAHKVATWTDRAWIVPPSGHGT